MKKTFAEWMRAVNAALVAKCGLDSRDLPDCNYADWYEDGVTPKGAASRALKAAKSDGY